MSNDVVPKKTVVKKATVAPKVIDRSKRKVLHHLFKAELAKFKKNLSFKPGSPNIQQIEHVHYFHSVDSVGLDQQFTNHVGGHCHKITWSVNETGELVASCGPAVRKRRKITRSGMQTVYEPVFFEDNFIDANSYSEDIDKPKATKVVDEHRHAMTYLGSDEVDPKILGASIKLPPEATQLDEDRKLLEAEGVKIT